MRIGCSGKAPKPNPRWQASIQAWGMKTARIASDSTAAITRRQTTKANSKR